MSVMLNHHPCTGMQPFPSSSEILTTSCSHENFTIISQVVQQLLCWQTHPQIDATENNTTSLCYRYAGGNTVVTIVNW